MSRNINHNHTNASSSTAHPTGHALPLPGLDGTNPLGFLAAMGTLRVLTQQWQGYRITMNWKEQNATWAPVIYADLGRQLNQDLVLDVLVKALQTEFGQHPSSLVDALSNEDIAKRRKTFSECVEQADHATHLYTDWLAALGSDAVEAGAINQLQTVRRDYFRGNLIAILAATNRDHLQRSLFHPWDYADALHNHSLHWDPSEDRRHAHQWNRPSGDPQRHRSGGMLGANRLAIEAIPLFTSFPYRDTLRTTGFSGTRSKNTLWTWPIWQDPLPLQVIRSLLAHPDLQQHQPDDEDKRLLAAQGVVAAYRTARILVGKTPNFTPARRIA